MKKISKKHMVRLLQKKHGGSAAEWETSLTAIFSLFTEALLDGTAVEMPAIGKLFVRVTENKATYDIKARTSKIHDKYYRLAFNSSPVLRTRLNADTKVIGTKNPENKNKFKRRR